jgi:hypothetical protein
MQLLAPLAGKLGIDLVWFGVLVGINLQTSFHAAVRLCAVLPAQRRAARSAPMRPAAARARVSTRTLPGVMPFVAVCGDGRRDRLTLADSPRRRGRRTRRRHGARSSKRSRRRSVHTENPGPTRRLLLEHLRKAGRARCTGP